MDGKLDDGKVVFSPTTGKRRYLAQKPEAFSATSKFPPEGQKDYSGTISDEKLTGKTDDGSEFLDNYLRVTRRAKAVVRKVFGS